MKHFLSSTLFFLLLANSWVEAQEYERYKLLLDTSITSKQLGYERPITVTVPFEWQGDLDQDFPLIIVFDRQNQRSHNYILNTIDYLTSNEQMPSCIVISIGSDEQHRYLETLHKASDEKGLAEANERSLFEELIPMAEKKFKASKFRLLIGHSRYGYFTTALLHSKAEQINGVISLSPFYTQKNVSLTDSIATINSKDHWATLYYRFGIGNDYPADFQSMESVIHTLNHKKLNFKGQLFKDADHNVTPGLTIATALYDVFEYWSLQQSDYIRIETKDLSVIKELEANIRTHYGKDLRFSLGILNGKAWEYFNNAEYDKAIEAWNMMLINYPNFSETYLYIMESQQKLMLNTSATAMQFKQSLARSVIYSEAEKAELLQELELLGK